MWKLLILEQDSMDSGYPKVISILPDEQKIYFSPSYLIG